MSTAIIGFSPSAQAVPIVAGNTDVRLTSAQPLSNLGISVAPLGTATLISGNGVPVVRFPITGGEVDDTTGEALIEHDGSGLSLTANTTVVRLENFLIDTGNGVLSGLVTVDGATVGTAPLLSFNNANGNGIPLSLTAQAATALNSAFGVNLSAGTPFGVASVSPILGQGPGPGPSPVSEPQTLAILAVGLLMGGLMLRRRSLKDTR